MELSDIFRTTQLNINLPKKFFSTPEGELYIFTMENSGSPTDRLYKYSPTLRQVVRIKRVKFDINLKNKLVLCSEDEFVKTTKKVKMMNELVK